VYETGAPGLFEARHPGARIEYHRKAKLHWELTRCRSRSTASARVLFKELSTMIETHAAAIKRVRQPE